MRRRKKKLESAWLDWSYSKLRAFHECPFRGAEEYLYGRRGPTHPILAVGSALHYFAERFFKVRYASADSFGKAWKHFWIGVLEGDHGPSRMRERPAPIAWEHERGGFYWLRRGEEILNGFYERNIRLFGSDTVLATERRFRVSWRGFTLTGVIDRIDSSPSGVLLRDYKMRHYPPYLLSPMPQAWFYATGYERGLRNGAPFNGAPLAGLRVENLFSGDEQVVPKLNSGDYLSFHRCLTEASAYVKGVLTGEPPPDGALMFQHFRADDISRRMFVPTLPRGEHCRTCSVIPACKEWERTSKNQPTALEMWFEAHDAAVRNSRERQGVFPFEPHEERSRRKKRKARA